MTVLIAHGREGRGRRAVLLLLLQTRRVLYVVTYGYSTVSCCACTHARNADR
jgi:hypothetical protein